MEVASMPADEDGEELTKTELEKLNNEKVNGLKGKLIEIRRAGAHPIYVKVAQTDTIETCLEKGDIPTDDDEMKIEAMAEGKTKWTAAKLSDKAVKFRKIVVTTKVSGSY